jgi:hypothetical protein
LLISLVNMMMFFLLNLFISIFFFLVGSLDTSRTVVEFVEHHSAAAALDATNKRNFIGRVSHGYLCNMLKSIYYSRRYDNVDRCCPLPVPFPPTRRIASLTLISVGGWIPPMRMLYFRGWLAGPTAFHRPAKVLEGVLSNQVVTW